MEFTRALIHWHMWNRTIRSESWVSYFVGMVMEEKQAMFGLK